MNIGFKGIQGYAYGAIQPSFVMRISSGILSTSPFASRSRQFLDMIRKNTLAPDPDLHEGEPAQLSEEQALASCIRALNRHCGDRVFTANVSLLGKEETAIAIPTLSLDLAKDNSIALLNFLSRSPKRIQDLEFKDFVEDRHKVCGKFLPRGTNRLNLIEAAAKRKIPFRLFGAPYLIFGYGCGSFILNSTITDADSSIGVGLARSKVATAQFLKISGFPVPLQKVVQSEQEALDFAKECGFPVVLKPDNQSQGRGVIAGISDNDELSRFYQENSKRYGNLIAEEHITGDHYRIDFFGDQLVKAVRRRAASVIGDGQTSVRDLVIALNDDPIRKDRFSSTREVQFDSDLDRTLSKQGLSVDEIPSKGQNVVLKSISNLSMGGVQVHVEDKVHEANYELCLAIARSMRLTILGVDILSPDISKPWFENGAKICEVNAQPQLGDRWSDAYGKLIDHFAKPQPQIDLVISRHTSQSERSLYDPEQKRITVKIPPEQILRDGCPTQFFDTLHFSDDVSDVEEGALRKMLTSVKPRVGEAFADRQVAARP